mgnify:CR=1 FL=1
MQSGRALPALFLIAQLAQLLAHAAKAWAAIIPLLDKNNPNGYAHPMKTVVHVEGFERKALALLGSRGLEDFITYIALNYAQGDIIAGTGGFKKLRWARPNAGKSGGFRVIYFVARTAIYPVLIYAKNDAANITPAQRNQLKAIAKLFEGA